MWFAALDYDVAKPWQRCESESTALVMCRRVADLFQSVQLNVNNPHFLIMQGRVTKVSGGITCFSSGDVLQGCIKPLAS